MASLQSIGLFRKRFLKFEDYNDASTLEETPRVLMRNDSVSKIMRDTTQSQLLDEVVRCPSIDETREARLSSLDKNNDGCSTDDGQNVDSGEYEELRAMEEIDFREDQTENERELENGVDQSCDDSLTNPVCSVPNHPAPPFGVFSFSGDQSVKLSSIGSTDVAVAQFAENNILPSDLAVLNLVLLNLQQQQLFQMHLLQQLQQQLQQQLMYATAGTASPSSTMPNFASPYKSPPKSFLPDFASTTTEAISSHSGGLPSAATSSSSPSDKVVPLPPNPSFNNNMESSEKLSSIVCTADNDCQNLEEVPVPPIMAMIGMSTRKLPFMPDKQLKEGGTLCAGNGLSSDGQGRGPGTDGHSSRNRCRFCQKVFSSDSALQIHIRSHTGERPYRCSICGNRFSTKGNLKVHFRCHTDTFSHLHLDQKPQLGLQLPDPVGLVPFPASPAMLPLQHSTSAETDPHRNKKLCFDGIDQNSMLSEIRSSRHTEEQDPSPSTSQARKTFGSSNWQEVVEEDVTLVPALEKAPCFPVIEEKDALPAASSAENLPHGTPAKSDSETPNSCKSNLLLSPPPPPLAAPPPPPLSLLSSMSSSFSAFPNPLFSSFSATHRPVITATMAPAPVALRPFGFGGPPPAYFRSSSLHSKREDPLEQFMEVQKSETTKMEKLVQNIEKKLSDPNQCGICYRTLSCKSALQMHYRTHTGERPFRCKICGRAFTTKGNLKTHMGVHRAKPPVRMLHQCPVCHKQFTNALVLQQHIRMHTGELPKQLPYHPGGMMIVPPAMGYLPPFPGYPFFPSGFNPGQQNPLLVPALETLKHRSQFGNLFQHNNEDTKPDHVPTGVLEETELDNLSKMDESSSSSSSSVFSSKENGDNENPRCSEMLRAETSQHSSLEDIDVESPNHEDKKLPSPDDGDEEDDDMSCMQEIDPLQERNHNRSRDELSNHNNESFMNDANVCGSADGSSHHVEMFEEEFSPLPATSGSLREEDQKAKSSYLEFEDYPHSKYSSSLMALEEKVNEINVHGMLSMAHPLQQMEKIIKRTEDIISLHANHARPTEEHRENADMEVPEGRKLATPSSLSYRVKSSYSPVGNRENTPSHTRNFGFMLGVDKARRSFGSMDLSPKSFEAATGKPNTTCSVCYKTFACKSALDIHYRSHTKERPFQCRICDRAFSTKGNMKQHMMTHKGCGDGQLLFSSDASSSSNPRSCPPLDDGPSMEKSDTSLQSMPRTPVETSPSDNPVSINGSFKSEDVMPTPSVTTPKMKPNFEEHHSHPMSMSPHNPSLGRRSALRHLCSVCQKPFSSASALQIHMRTHTGDRPFTCTVCNKAFTTKGNLKVHMGTHMWNNGPSRRGRRMSVEGIAGMAPPPPKSAEFFGGPSRIPALHELYHFPFHGGFRASFGSPKLNEISVIQKMNGAMQHFLPDSGAPDMMGAHLIKPLPFPLQAPRPPLPPQLRPLENQVKCRDDGPAGGNNNTWAMNNDSPQRGNSGELDLSVKKSLPLASQMSPVWMWKTSCNLCSKVCSSPGALEIHMKTHPDFSQKTDSPKSVIA